MSQHDPEEERRIEQTVLQTLQARRAIETGHFVLTSGRHSGIYVRKDLLFVYPKATRLVCSYLTRIIGMHHQDVDCVVAPALGGIALTQWVGDGLEEALQHPVKALFAEKDHNGELRLARGYDIEVRGRTVAVLEDVMTTGDSAKDVVQLVTAAGGNVVVVAGIVNRGNVTADMLGAPDFRWLASMSANSWPAADCPLCKSGAEVSTHVGKGREFLAAQHT